MHMPGFAGPGVENNLALSGASRRPMYGSGSAAFRGGSATSITGNPILDMAISSVILPKLLGENAASGIPLNPFSRQNPYHQMRADRYTQEYATATGMDGGGNADQASIAKLMGGIMMMATGQPLTDQQQAKIQMGSQYAPQLLPMLAGVVGTNRIDQLMGTRGSATLMAGNIYGASASRLDPITGAMGFSGRSSRMLTDELQSQLYDDPERRANMQGMGGGEVGELYQAMESRGMLGAEGPYRTMYERSQDVPALDSTREARLGLKRAQQLQKEEEETTRKRVQAHIARLASGEVAPSTAAEAQIIDEIAAGTRDPNDDATINALAATAGVSPITAAGKPSRDQIDRGKQDVRDSHAQIKARGAEMSQAEVAALPMGEELMSSGDAARAADRIEGMTGVISAMRDIFGDMGKPNAPMAELVAGIDMFTQNQLATKSPAELDMMVRRIHEIAKASDIGLEGMLALSAQTAELARQLNVSPAAAVDITMSTVSSVTGMKRAGSFDISGYGAVNREQMTQIQGQLGVQAAGSSLGATMGGLAALQHFGVIDADTSSTGDDKLSRMIKAYTAGADTFEYVDENGKTQTGRVSDVRPSEARELVRQKYGDEAARKFAEAQRDNNTELAANEFGTAGASAAAWGEIGANTRRQAAASMQQNLKDKDISTTGMSSKEFAEGFADHMDTAWVEKAGADPKMTDTDRRELMAAEAEQYVRDQLISQGLSGAALDRETARIVGSLGGGAGMYADYGLAAEREARRATDGTGGALARAQATNPLAQKAAADEDARVRRDAEISSDLSAHTSAGFGANIFDALRDATQDTPISDVLAEAMPYLSDDERTAYGEDIGAAGLRDAIEVIKTADRSTPEGRAEVAKAKAYLNADKIDKARDISAYERVEAAKAAGKDPTAEDEAIVEADASGAINDMTNRKQKATRAIEQMAIDQGAFKDEVDAEGNEITKASQLTDEQKATAADKIDREALDKEDQKKFDAARRHSVDTGEGTAEDIEADARAAVAGEDATAAAPNGGGSGGDGAGSFPTSIAMSGTLNLINGDLGDAEGRALTAPA